MKEYKYKINGNLYKVTVGNIEDNIADVEVNGTPVVVKPVVRQPATTPAPQATQVNKPAAAPSKSGVKSPLPGVILEIKVNVGDAVKKGQTVVIAINVKPGDSVLEGTDLVIIE